MGTAAEAQRKIDAIDKRIDAVHAELVRHAGAFDEMSAHAWQVAWDRYPGLRGIERSLYLRRAHAHDIWSDAAFKEARAAERKAAREFRAAEAARRRACPTCGSLSYAA